MTSIDDRTGIVTDLYMTGEDSPFVVPWPATAVVEALVEALDGAPDDSWSWLRLPTLHWERGSGEPRAIACSWFRTSAVTSVHDRVVPREELEDLVLTIGEARNSQPGWFPTSGPIGGTA